MRVVSLPRFPPSLLPRPDFSLADASSLSFISFSLSNLLFSPQLCFKPTLCFSFSKRFVKSTYKFIPIFAFYNLLLFRGN